MKVKLDEKKMENILLILVLFFFPLGFYLLVMHRKEIRIIDNKLIVGMFCTIVLSAISFYSLVFGSFHIMLGNILIALLVGGMLSCAFWITRIPTETGANLRFIMNQYNICLIVDSIIITLIYLVEKAFLYRVYNSETLFLRNFFLLASLVAWNIMLLYINKKYPRSRHV